MLNPEQAVLEANTEFYEAFAAGDVRAMGDVWARKEVVVCIHPGWQPLRGREHVMASWRAILTGGSPPVRCTDATVTVMDQMAVVVCTERLPDARLAATNIFVLEEGLWKMVHHHASAYSERDVPTSEPTPPPHSLN